jgi:hypothetical protein
LRQLATFAWAEARLPGFEKNWTQIETVPLPLEAERRRRRKKPQLTAPTNTSNPIALLFFFLETRYSQIEPRH